MQPRIELIPERPSSHIKGADLHVLVRIHTPAAALDPKRLPLNLALVLDRSGSMSGAKLEYALAAARFVMERLEPEDRVSVVAFDDQIEIPLPSAPARGVNIRRVLGAITARGSTNLHGGWLEGGTQVAAHLRPGALNRVLLLSDGLANVGETNADRIASDVRGLAARGVSTSALGIGRDFDEDMMQAIAQSGDGNYHFIEHPNALPHIFATELQGLKNTFARTVSLGLEGANGVQVLDVLNDAPRNSHGRLMLPNLLYGQTLEVLVKLRLPAHEGTNPLEALRVRLAYTPASGATRTVQHERLSTHAVSDREYRAQTAHEDVLEALALFETARAKAEMIASLDRGDAEGTAALIAGQSAALAAAPASARVMKEMAALEELKADLERDQAVMRKRAAAQRYEKQRGY
jgi:Ca-activated chloride channel family protein